MYTLKTIWLLIFLLCYSFCNGQWAHQKKCPYNKKNEVVEFIPPICILASGFAINEMIIRSNSMDRWELKKNTAMIYGTTAITSIATHYIIKNIRKKKKSKRMFKNRVH